MTSLVADAWLEVRRLLQSQQQSVAHRLDHVERVYGTAMKLAEPYPGIDLELLQLSVLFHDICQPYDKKDQHVALSRQIAKDTLEALNCSTERIEEVLAVISEHSTEHIDTVKPTRLESRILFDADKLDGLGATGIARVFALFGQRGKAPLDAIGWYIEKIEKARTNMQTPEGMRLFDEHLGFVFNFLQRLQAENNKSTGGNMEDKRSTGSGLYS